nr:MAG TPA: hypothetical protein [Caudoviricetes sp.]
MDKINHSLDNNLMLNLERLLENLLANTKKRRY